LKATNPSLRYRIAIDAAFGVAPETIDYAHSVPCMTLGVHCSYEETMLSDYNDRDRSFWSAIIEESCLAWHTAHQPGTEWRCADGFHVITNHVTTPFFIHMDEQDSNVGGSYVEQFGTWDMFGQKIEQQLRDLALLNTTAEEGGALATPGAFGPQCTDHESFTNDSAVYDVRVNGLTYESALWNWWSGAQPQVAIHAFSGAGPAADCPK